jgi:hypothetical protein
MQTYIQYRVCEGPLPRLSTLKHSSNDTNPTCFIVKAHSMRGACTVNADDLLSFLETCGDTPEKLQVLWFLSKHPRTRCTFECLCSGVEAQRWGVQRAVRELTHQGVIEECSEDQNILYGLTHESERRNSVENLGQLTWDQIRFWNEYRIIELAEEQVSS